MGMTCQSFAQGSTYVGNDAVNDNDASTNCNTNRHQVVHGASLVEVLGECPARSVCVV